MKNIFFFVIIIFWTFCSEKQSKLEFQKERARTERIVVVDSMLIEKAMSFMELGTLAYQNRDLEACRANFFSADSLLQLQQQWPLAVKNLINTITLAQATKQTQDSLDALVKYTEQIVDKLPSNDWSSGSFYKKKASIFKANKYFENSKFSKEIIPSIIS